MKVLQNIRFAPGIATVDLNGGAATAIAVDLGAVNIAPVQELAVLLQFGNIAAACSTGTFKIEHSNDNSTWATCSNGTFTDTTSTDTDNKCVVGYVQTGGTLRRYVRVSITGGAGATLVGATWMIVTGQMPNSDTERGVVQSVNANT